MRWCFLAFVCVGAFDDIIYSLILCLSMLLTKKYFVIIAVVFLFAGCQIETGPSPATPQQPAGDMQTFDSVEQLQEYLSESSDAGFGVSSRSFAQEMVADAPMMAESDFSTTNVQEQGVDEADIFKTDGEYIYTSSDRTLFITSTGDDTSLLSSTGVNMSVQGLFLEGDSLVVIGSSSRGFGPAFSRSIWPSPRSSEMSIRVFDVSSPSRPELERTVEFEGYFVDARLRDGVAYVVSNSGVSFDNPLPFIRVDGVESSLDVSRISYFPGRYESPQLTTVHTLDLDSLSIESDGVLTESTQNVYMDEFLYLSSTSYINEYDIRQEVVLDLGEEFLSVDDRDLIGRIRATDSDVLHPSEKEQKILQVYFERFSELTDDERESFEDEVDLEVKTRLSEFTFREYTNVAKFAASSDGIVAVASGQVPGRVYEQFGFDEARGALRVVTTTSGEFSNGSFDRGSENHIFSLDQELSVLDSVGGIAPGESIFSARYTDERLYLVTFEQVDPFFVVDVSDNEDLRILGELKITGFSRYLHPLSENTVLGFGREATDTGRQQGLKVSLFDVSDVSSPREIAKWVDDERFTSSSAEFEHHALLLDVDRELLVVPVSSYGRDSRFSGAYVFRLSEEDISLRGLVEHDQQVERSAYIDEYLYTKSFDLLRVNTLSDLSSVARVSLEQVSDADIPIY